jgi:branched-chain amino acid transport system substrate-binding protein
MLAIARDFQGITGKITINEKRDATKSAVILRVEKGEFKFVESIQP